MIYGHMMYDLICPQVPLARSEGNLLDLMERVCERMEDYGEHTDSSTNRKSYIRVKSRSGEAMDLSEAMLDSRVTASLKFAVSTIFCAALLHNPRNLNASFCVCFKCPFITKLLLFMIRRINKMSELE